MALIELPSGITVDTEGLEPDQVESVIAEMQTSRPELFEAQPVQPSINLATASNSVKFIFLFLFSIFEIMLPIL